MNYHWTIDKLIKIQFIALQPEVTIAQWKQTTHPDRAIETRDWTTPAFKDYGCSR